MCGVAVIQNPLGTIPTLEADGRVFINTTDVIAYLLQHAPRKVKAGTPAVIEAVHNQKYDPNFSMLVAVCFPSNLHLAVG